MAVGEIGGGGGRGSPCHVSVTRYCNRAKGNFPCLDFALRAFSAILLSSRRGFRRVLSSAFARHPSLDAFMTLWSISHGVLLFLRVLPLFALFSYVSHVMCPVMSPYQLAPLRAFLNKQRLSLPLSCEKWDGGSRTGIVTRDE